MKPETKRSCILVILAILSIIAMGAGVSLQGHTLISVWVPSGLAAMIALGTAPMAMDRWRRITDTNRWWINLPCHIIVAGSLSFAIFLGINRVGAHTDQANDVEATVISKYSKTHDRYRRVGRRNIRDGEWHSYHLSLQLPDGRIKDTQVPFSTYRHSHNGTHRTVCIAPGLLGMDVIIHPNRKDSNKKDTK
ncbi:MAG: hypothetical protein HFJ91_00075 [Muribaculaceae bacterium]|nr:hypothetical protein [Muribaculaceae bacterium]